MDMCKLAIIYGDNRYKAEVNFRNMLYKFNGIWKDIAL